MGVVIGDDRVRWRGRVPRPSLRRRLPPVTCVTFHFVDEGTDQAGGRDLRAVRDETIGRLAAAGVPDPDVDAELLIGHVLGLSRGGVQARLVVGGALGEADAATLESAARGGIDEVAAAIPAGTGEQLVQRVRSEVWGRGVDGLEYVPTGAAFAAFSLGFLGDDPVRLFETGPWTRLTTRRGHVLVRRKPWTLKA